MQLFRLACHILSAYGVIEYHIDWMAAMLRRTAISLVFALAVSGCVNPNQVAMRIGAPPELKKEGKSTVSLRALQVRRFEVLNERILLQAATQTLQDLGFTISESSLEAGVLVGSKKRDAVESGQVAGQLLLALLAAVAGSSHNPTWDKEQTIVVTLITTPVKNSKQIETRVSFDRRLTNNRGQLWRAELITEAPIYQEFFDKLSKSIFLEAHII